jgi:hypothetical protein
MFMEQRQVKNIRQTIMIFGFDKMGDGIYNTWKAQVLSS